MALMRSAICLAPALVGESDDMRCAVPAMRAPLPLAGLPCDGQAEVDRVKVSCLLDADIAELGHERVREPAGERAVTELQPPGQVAASGCSADMPGVTGTPSNRRRRRISRELIVRGRAGQQLLIDQHGHREPAERKFCGGPPLLELGAACRSARRRTAGRPRSSPIASATARRAACRSWGTRPAPPGQRVGLFSRSRSRSEQSGCGVSDGLVSESSTQPLPGTGKPPGRLACRGAAPRTAPESPGAPQCPRSARRTLPARRPRSTRSALSPSRRRSAASSASPPLSRLLLFRIRELAR